MELEYQRLDFLLCINKKERIEGKLPSPEGIIHVRRFNPSLGSWVLPLGLWVRRLGSWVHCLSLWVLLLGFAAQVRWFVGLSIGFVTGFMVDLLFRVVSTLISCLCLYLCFCCFFGCGFFFSEGRRVRGFFSKGSKGRRRKDWLFGFLMWNSSV